MFLFVGGGLVVFIVGGCDDFLWVPSGGFWVCRGVGLSGGMEVVGWVEEVGGIYVGRGGDSGGR